MTLEQQILDAINAGAFTRDLLHARFPRVSQDAIDIKVFGLRRERCIEENAVGRLTCLVTTEQLAELTYTEPEPPDAPVQPAVPARSEPVTDDPVAAEDNDMARKTCSKCDQSKPLSEFYKKQGKCKPCFLFDQRAAKLKRAAAAWKLEPQSRQPRKVLPPPRQTSKRAAVKAPRGNGPLLIPAGTEIRAEVLHDQGVVRFIEIASRDLSPGDEADRTWSAVKMDLYQAKRLSAWLLEVLPE